MYEQMDVRPLLPLVRVPSLILWRDEDRLIPPRSRARRRGDPGSEGGRAAGHDHIVFAGDQEAVLGEIEEFVTGRRSGPPSRAGPCRRSSSPTSSARPSAPPRWATCAGGECSRSTTGSAAARSNASGGRYVNSTGDGLLASFDGPARAITAAAEIGRALEPLDLPIRAGVHTGECERIGEDLGGIAVHIGARVSSAAEPGEILVSQTVRDLVVGSGIEFADRGVRDLKGVPGEWHLYAVA